MKDRMGGGRGRGRSRGRGTPDPSASAPSKETATATVGSVGGRRACESCEAAPGMPFCRVEWSFLCSSCGPTLHRNSWIVAVPPFPGPGPSPSHPAPPNPNPIPNPNPTTADSSQPNHNQPSSYFFPPNMQMPPMHTPFQMPMPMPMHPPNPNTTSTVLKRKRRRLHASSSSKEQMPGPAPAPPDTDTDPDRAEAESESVMQNSLKCKTRSPPSAPTRTDTGNAYSELHPGVEDTMTADMPESAEDEAQVDAMENLAAEMEPPPPELDEMEQVIETQGEH